MIQGDSTRLRAYERIVADFVEAENGVFVAVSEDVMFLSVLRNAAYRHLGLPEERFVHVTAEARLLPIVQEIAAAENRMVIFLEEQFRSKNTYVVIKKIKEIAPTARVIVLVGNTTQHSLAMCYEMGADNFLAKPVSVNLLVAKVAQTLVPQGRVEQLLSTGTAMLEKGDTEGALQLADAMLERTQENAAAHVLRGDALTALDRGEEALEAYELACSYAKMYLKPLQKLAEIYRSQGDTDSELSALEKLDQVNPLNADRKVDMGTIHVQKGDETRANSLFRAAIDQSAKELLNYIEDVSLRIGDIYSNQDPIKAEGYYRMALDGKDEKYTPSDLRTFNLLGMALRRQGKWEKAVQEYEKALTVAPDDENLHYNLAMAYAEGKDFPQAETYLRTALDLNPAFGEQDATIAYNVGLILYQAGKKSEAAPHLRTSTKLDASFRKAADLLAVIESSKD